MSGFDDLDRSKQRSARDDRSEEGSELDDDDENGLLEGFRDFDWGNGESYRGEWVSNAMHGRGKYVCKQGTYQGEMFGHQMHGQGRFDFKGGGAYYGRYVEGRREGEGVMSYPDGSVYQGQWENNMRHGQGTIQFGNQDLYEGEWVEDERTGPGTYVSKQRTEVFKGEFKENVREGVGEVWIKDPDHMGVGDHFHRYLVEYDDGILKRKRSRPSSDVPWPKEDPWAQWESLKFLAIDTGETDFAERQIEAAEKARIDLLRGQSRGDLRTASEESDDDALDAALFGKKDAHLMRLPSEGGDEDGNAMGAVERRDSLAGVDDTIFHRRSALMKILCCSTGADAVSVPEHRGNTAGSKRRSVSRGNGGRQHKSDIVVVVRVYKAQYLPKNKKNAVNDTFVAARMGRDQQAGDVVKDSFDPTYQKKFEFELPEAGKKREVVLRVHRVPKSGDVEVVGKVVLELEGKELGYHSEMMNYFLTSEDGNKPIMGRNDKGHKVGSQLRLTFEITLRQDALFTLFVDRCTNLYGVDPTTFSSPYIKVIYGDVELTTKPAKRNFENPQYQVFLSFDAHSLDALARLNRKPVLIPSKLIVECWEYFLFGSHVYLGSFEVDLSKQKFGRANVTKHTTEFKDPDRPAKNIGSMMYSLVWGSNEMTSLKVLIQEGYHLPKCAYGTQPRQGVTMKSGKQTAQPDMDSSCTIVLDQQLGLLQKSKVYVENLNPQYEETLWFDIRQNELPAHMVVQVYDNRKGLGGTRQHLVGESDFDLSQLVLDGLPQTRWCRLEHPELKAAVEEIDKRAEKERRMIKAMQRGEDFEVDAAEDDEEEEKRLQQTFLGRLLGKRANALRMETEEAKLKKKLNATIKEIEAGVDPGEQGRVKVQVQWLSVPDEDDAEVQAMWDVKMSDPKNRKIVKRLIVSWSHETMKKALQGFQVYAQRASRDTVTATMFHMERCLPKHYRAWKRRVKAKQNAESSAKYWAFRNRLTPCFFEWNLAIIDGANEKRLAKGKPLRKKVGHAEAEIEEPLALESDGNFAEFEKHARPARKTLETKYEPDSWAPKKSESVGPSRVPKALGGGADLSMMI